MCVRIILMSTWVRNIPDANNRPSTIDSNASLAVALALEQHLEHIHSIHHREVVRVQMCVQGGQKPFRRPKQIVSHKTRM